VATLFHDLTLLLRALEVSDNATGNTHEVCWRSTEVIVPSSRCGPHLVVLQQVRINEHTQLCAVAKRRNAAFGLGNPRERLFKMLVRETSQ
jgi:hypothetical protein